MFLNDFDSTDTPTEATVRRATVGLRTELRAIIAQCEQVLTRLDKGEGPRSHLRPGRAIDASTANGYAAQLDALMSLPWDHADHGYYGTADKVDEIIRTSGIARR